MSALRNLRRWHNLLGLGALLALLAASLFNLWFIDSLRDTSYYRIQGVWMLVGLIAGGVVARLDLELLRRTSLAIYLTLVLLLVAVLVVGKEINASRRWLDLGPMRMQPSEFMKLSVVLTLADLFDRARATEPWSLRTLARPALLTLVPFVLVNLEPDLGTSLCILMVAAAVILYEGVSKRTLMAGLAVILLGVPLAWRTGAIRDYQKGRVAAWATLDETALAQRRSRPASQPEQALWAVGSGQLWGRSLDDARVSVLRHLPFLHTDFAFAAWARAFGLIGSLALFLGFGVLLWWMLYVADHADGRFDALICVGSATLIFSQLFVNAGMVIGMLPVVGMTMPLVSYGGSSVLTVLLATGLVLNVALRHRSLR